MVTANDKAKTLFASEQIEQKLGKNYRLLQSESFTTIKEWEQFLPDGIVPVAYDPYHRDGHAEGGVLVVRPRRAVGHTVLLASQALTESAFDIIIGQSSSMRALKNRALRMAVSPAPVLIHGETGSGKELFARAVHCAGSGEGAPFVAVNCGTLTRELAVSELLGYEPGAFTGAAPKGRVGKFEEADGGTLFLDEISELPADVQVVLLRVLQDNIVVRLGSSKERKVKVRLITATNRSLTSAVEQGRFRQDLFYRLKVMSLDIMPLRERPGDIKLLADLFLRELAQIYGVDEKQLEPQLLEILSLYNWPGNVRELRAVLESMHVMSDGKILSCKDLPAGISSADNNPSLMLAHSETIARTDRTLFKGDATLDELEREAIQKKLVLHNGNRTKAAKSLDIS